MITENKKLIPPRFSKWVWDNFSKLHYTLNRSKLKPLHLRPNTSDLDVYRSVMIQGEFNYNYQTPIQTIVDLGAYTGITATSFRRRFPQAEIIAVEPETTNYEMLCKNTANMSNFKAINKGIWSRDAYLKITDSSTEKWAFTTEEVDKDESWDIEAICMKTLMEENHLTHIDLLKIDIEGAERALFNSDDMSWLNRVNYIFIELHDRLFPGCKDALMNAIDSSEWNIDQHGEKLILERKAKTT